MIRRINLSIIGGLFIALCAFALVPLPSLRGTNTPVFLFIYFLSSVGYVLAVLRLSRDNLPVSMVFGLGVIFRVILIFTAPSLSDDVYRYVWDGHLLNNGINPYAYPVNSAMLDAVSTPLRDLVNHDWMASPYLPTSQLFFGLVGFLFPQNIFAFQVTSVLLDLLTGYIILDILRKLSLPGRNVLVYLWNPLVIIEFSNSAHIDALMICLIMTSFWLILKTSKGSKIFLWGSAIALATAVMTKLIPILLLPILIWSWGWKRVALFLATIALLLGIFIPGIGLGIFGPIEGTGIFGALMIYLRWWNYNSGIYHWIEVLLSGYITPGPVPVEVVGETPIIMAKVITASFFSIVVFFSGFLAWRVSKSGNRHEKPRILTLIRISLLPLGAYLLFTTTIHPWYVVLVIPFLPFLFSGDGKNPGYKSFVWPWIYFSIAVALSYLTYLDPANLRETAWVRLVEYIPFYCLLGWAAWRSFWKSKKNLLKSVNIS